MSTEEIIQRTRLLDSEIKVGSQPQGQRGPRRADPGDPSSFFHFVLGLARKTSGPRIKKEELSLRRDSKRVRVVGGQV